MSIGNLPSLNGLKAFDVAARHLNFRLAAEELGVTQGAVAQHVRGLEAELGVTLFERLPKSLALTGEGRSYVADVRRAFELLANATANLKPQPVKLVVSTTPTFASRWLIPRLPDFTSRHPDLDLHILATDRISSFRSTASISPSAMAALPSVPALPPNCCSSRRSLPSAIRTSSPREPNRRMRKNSRTTRCFTMRIIPGPNISIASSAAVIPPCFGASASPRHRTRSKLQSPDRASPWQPALSSRPTSRRAG